MLTEAWLETLARDAIDKVRKGIKPEDSRIELKGGEVQNVAVTARQLAAHANAARGANVIWIIGVNENKQCVDGAKIGEFASWFAQLASQFNGSPPYISTHINITCDDKPVIVLLFDTRNAPYVVANPSFGKGGSVKYEVPWRYGTSAHSAERSELIKILVPQAELPECELLLCEMSCGHVGGRILGLRLVVYMIASRAERIAIPLHRCVGRFRVTGDEAWVRMARPSVQQLTPSATVVVGASEVLVDVAGTLDLRFAVDVREYPPRGCTMDVETELRIARNDNPILMSASLLPAPRDDDGFTDPKWVQRGSL